MSRVSQINMAANLEHGDNFLPDLKNELTGEQIVLQQKVFRSNQAFGKTNEEIIAWFKSPKECRAYPKF